MAAGIEPSRRLADTARSLGRIVLQGTLPHPGFEKRAFDLVTLVDVVEHVTEPVSVFRHCVDPVAGDGLVVVVTQMWAVPRR